MNYAFDVSVKHVPPVQEVTLKRCPVCSIMVANIQNHFKTIHKMTNDVAAHLTNLVASKQTNQVQNQLRVELANWHRQEEAEEEEEDYEEEEFEPVVKIEEHDLEEEEEVERVEQPVEMDNKARCPVCSNIVACPYMERHLIILHRLDKAEVSNILTGLGISAATSVEPAVPKPPEQSNQVKRVRCTVCNNVVAHNLIEKHLKILHKMAADQLKEAMENLIYV